MEGDLEEDSTLQSKGCGVHACVCGFSMQGAEHTVSFLLDLQNLNLNVTFC